MTLETTIVEESFTGTGSTTIFDTAIQAFETTEILCYLQNDTTKVYSTLVLDTDYTVSNLLDADGVVVTLAVAPEVGTTLIVQRELPIKQMLDIQNQEGFNPESVERELDRIVAMIQQVDRRSRASLGLLWDTGPELFLFDNDGYLYYDASENEVYNMQNDPSGTTVVQVTPPEITAGTETALRSYAPTDIVSFIEQHAPQGEVLTDVETSRIIGRVTAGTGDSEELTAAQVRTLLNVEDGAEVNEVDSVNGATGTVVLDPDDLDDAATAHKFISQTELAKLAGIESGATADQTAAEIKTAYESNANTNAFTDARLTKLNGIESGAQVNTVTSVNGEGGAVILDPDDLDDTTTTNKFISQAELDKLAGIESGATGDQSAAEIKTAYESNANTNAFTDTLLDKLNNIESGATADQSAAEIKTAYESNANTNAFTDAEQTKLAGIEAGAEVNDVTSVNGNTGAVTLDPDDLDDASTTHKFISAAELTKLSGIESGATADQTDAEIKTAYENNADTNAFTDALLSKLNGIEANADVTDTTNVTAAGALMDSELTSLSGVKTLSVPDSTTITSFGASLVDDANASAARTTLGLGTMAVQNIAAVTASIIPNVTGSIDLGSASKRWSTVHAATGTFGTMLAGFMGAGDGGSLPTFAGGTAGSVANTSGASDWTSFSIIAGNAGQSALFFGDTDDEDVGYLTYDHTNNELQLGAAGQNSWLLDTSRAVLGGFDDSDTAGFGIEINKTGTTTWQRPSSQGDNQKVLLYIRGTTDEFIVRSDGDVQNTNNSYGAISDARLKENMRPATSQWDDVLAAELVNYNRIGRSRKHLGFSAQQLEEAGIAGPVREGEDGVKSVAYSIMYLKAFGALQEAMRRIEALEEQLCKKA